MAVATQVDTPVSAYRPFRVRLARRLQLGPSLVRLTLTGDDLHLLGPQGFDQRVKLVIPLPGHGVDSCPTGPDWLARWRAMPVHQRPALRTYTIRAARPALREVDLDVVLHGASGPASAWAERAVPGDEVVLIGPDVRFDGDSGGVEWRPPADAAALLLAGDETALPAICAIVERLPPTARGHAVVEVPEDGDVPDVPCPAGVTLTWLPRRGERRGRLLTDAVLAVAPGLLAGTPGEDGLHCGLGATGAPAGEAPEARVGEDELLWDVPAEPPSTPCYAWLAGEAGVVTHLRRCLVRDLGVDRRCVAFMGYWREGRAASS